MGKEMLKIFENELQNRYIYTVLFPVDMYIDMHIVLESAQSYFFI